MLRRIFSTHLLHVFLCSILLLAFALPTFANHRKGTYGTHGYAWFARYSDYAVAWVTSNNCNAQETGAYTRIQNSTAGTTEVSGRWPTGIQMSQYTCDSVVDNNVDIDIEYSDFNVTHAGGTFGGENHSTAAPSSWCSVFGHPSPCGYHPSTVHINQSKWNANTTTWRERLIMHETGHSLGLSHHCTEDAIMNDGTSTCNGGKWSAVMTYQPTDRQGIRDTYPSWMYP